MMQVIRNSVQWAFSTTVGVCLLALFAFNLPVSAQEFRPIPNPDPAPGSYGLEATKTQVPPTRGASITTPGNGSSFSTSPVTVNGICPTGLMVQIYNNGVMVGSVMCNNGSFSIQVSLFVGANEISASVFDELDQTGPASNVVTVNYNNSTITAFGQLITLTSSYGRRSAPAGNILTWPLQLSGGTGPYAFSIDWGDGTPPELKSQALAGLVDIRHAYKKAGIYQVNIRVTDANGVSAFLQLIAVASGKVDSAAAGNGANADTGGSQANLNAPKILWAPMAVSLVLMLPTYWLGRRSQLVSLRNKMIKERDYYNKKSQ